LLTFLSLSSPFFPSPLLPQSHSNTRLAKLDAPESPFTAIILAHAGLVRINLGHRSTSLIDPPTLHYAVGQGALGIETRSLDPEVAFVVKDIGHWQTEWRTAAERGCLRKLEGGCSVPVGVESSLEVEKDEGPESGEGGRKGKLSLRGTVTSLDGSEHVVHGEVDVEVGSFAECERLGTKVAEELIAKGAGKILIAIEEGKNQKGTVVGTEVLAAAPAH
jgi:hydroxymethylbilane synthase